MKTRQDFRPSDRPRPGAHPARRIAAIAALLLATPVFAGCVTLAEFRKLEDEVWQIQQRGAAGSPDRARQADLAAEMDEMRRELESLRGQLEEVDHRTAQALTEARAARQAAAGTPGTPGTPGALPAAPADGTLSPVSAPEPRAAPPSEPVLPGAAPEEVRAYRDAYTAWRGNQHGACIDRFRNFLQTYPASAHADDAAYWLADCYFKKGDFKTAVLRFDDVVARYPAGNKAPDALYRQGEALLRLGPGYSKAAGKAFERVLAEYPDSERAGEAQHQLELLGTG